VNEKRKEKERDQVSISSMFYDTIFIRKFVQSQNVTRKKAFVRKICVFNVDEIDHKVEKVRKREERDGGMEKSKV